MSGWSTSAQLAHSNGAKVLCYSRSGIGKTVLCATAPYPVILSAEAGLLSLNPVNLQRIFGVNTPGITYDIPVYIISTIQDLRNAYALFSNPAQGMQNQFRTLCLDSLTEIAEKVLANAKLGVKDPRQAYGELIDETITLVKQFRDLDAYNVYMSAKLELFKDEMTGITMAGPAMPGSKLGPQLPYLFDEVLYYDIGINTQDQSKYRYIRTSPDMRTTAKDRSGNLAELETPHLGYLFNKILTGV